MVAPELDVEVVPLASLKPHARNARVHPKAQIRQLARLIREMGFLVPILIDGDGNVIAGHGRLLAATDLGLSSVPAIRVEHLTAAQIKALRIADNRITENADWDPELLGAELKELLELDFDIDLLGFENGELDVLICDGSEGEDQPVPVAPANADVVSQPGDLFELGDGHRIACGDSRDPTLLGQLMRGENARMVLSDPPFNVPIEGHVSGLGKNHHAEFQMASGEMSPAEFVAFLTQAIGVASSVCVEGALLYLFMDWRHIWELHAACLSQQLTVMNLAVWDKTVGGMGSLYRSQHELVLIVRKGKSPHLNNVQLGKQGRYRTNVWSLRGANSFGAGRDEVLAAHPTVKPTALLREAILDCTRLHDIVFDGFLGSGSTVLAAEQARRRCYGIEIEPRYVDVALLRWIAATGRQPVHLATGLTFEALREQRRAAASGAAPPIAANAAANHPSTTGLAA